MFGFLVYWLSCGKSDKGRRWEQGSHTAIRPKEEIEAWRKKDPIERFERYLHDNGVMDEEEIDHKNENRS